MAPTGALLLVSGVHSPSTRQVRTAGGFDSLVSHVREMRALSVTSRGPETLTDEGESAERNLTRNDTGEILEE